MNASGTRPAGRVVWYVVAALTAVALLLFAYNRFAPSSRSVPKGTPVSVTLREGGDGQLITITNPSFVTTFVKTLRSGHATRLNCDCAIAAANFEVTFADGAVLPVQYTLGHETGRFVVRIDRHLYSVPLSELVVSLKRAGIKMPGLPWDYAEDGIPKWPTNTMSP